MKVSKGKTQPELVADIRLSSTLHGSGCTILVPGLDGDSHNVYDQKMFAACGLGDFEDRHPGNLLLLKEENMKPDGSGPTILPSRLLDQVFGICGCLVLFIFSRGLQKHSFCYYVKLL